ncbi:MAG: hypothetical protein RMK57_16440 [Bryobacterales bacterium]|nr:hypothetical protein [Bryobacteraceae bacterium]MDW8356111.1 hypothetical protein [Bryobacterales bacterium]
MTTTDIVAAAGRWFLCSAIRDTDGGVARYYRFDTQRYAPISTEISGYVAEVLVWLHKLTGDPAYRTAGVRSGHFLTRTAWDASVGAMPFEWPCTDGIPAVAYFFDSGIVARGLLTLWRATGEEEFLERAVAVAESMARDFQSDNGCWHARLTLPSKEPLGPDARWSTQFVCHQLKGARAWQELAEITGQGRWRQLYEKVLRHALATHTSFLDGEPGERRMDRLHAYCYFLEGLLVAVDEPAVARVLREGLAEVSRRLRELASLFERSDVWAQLLRLRLYAEGLGVAPLDRHLAEEEWARIQQFHLEHPDPRVNGAFAFGRKRGHLLPFANPASTIFCLQAVEMWRRYLAGSFQPALCELI